jgi:ClpX C4-type zinc finger
VAVTKASPTGGEAAIICSFCMKPTSDVATMVGGPGVFICNECVSLCVELIKTKPADMPTLPSSNERVNVPGGYVNYLMRELADEDLLATLPKIAAAGVQVDRQLSEWVTQARARGITWTRIGAALGMTRQSAWERFSGEE